MKLYRIYTENLQRIKIEAEANKLLESYTILTGTGYWRGANEDILVIECIAGESTMEYIKIKQLARTIKALNKQDAVLVTSQDVDSWMV